MPNIQISVVKVRQNIGDLFVGVMKARDLFAIAEADRIRLETLKIPQYAGYQRALVEERVNSIRDYLNTPRSTFPNAIILSLDSDYIDSWNDVGNGSDLSTLEIKRERGAVKIIDGQHRAAALDAIQDEFQVIVSFFVDLRTIQCAEIFAKINTTQKAVNPSIAFQLFGYLEERSPQRTAHEIAETLNTTNGSPFYKQLKMLGTKDSWSEGYLSQSTFCKELMSLYTRDPVRDENRLLRKETLEDYPGYPLRPCFKAGQDQKILETIWRFFLHVAQTWPDQWSDSTGRSILTKTTGYIAFLRVLKHWLLIPSAEDVREDRGVREAFNRIRDHYVSSDKIFIRDNYPSGNQGVIRLRDALIHDLHL